MGSGGSYLAVFGAMAECLLGESDIGYLAAFGAAAERLFRKTDIG